MKNHIALKFIAIVLCAASLLGAVGSGLGIFAMTEMGLYDRSVEEAYESYVEGYVDNLSIQILERYASMNLGGASSQLADSFCGNYWSSSIFDMSRVGYTIWDENGSAVSKQTLHEGYPVEQTFLFDATSDYSGSYIRVISETPESEYYQANAPVLPEGVTTNIGDDYVYNAIPAEGAEVYSLQIEFDEGNSEGIAAHGESLGTISRLEDGTVVFASEGEYEELEVVEGGFSTYICFWTMDGQVIYEASSPDGVLESTSWGMESGWEIICRNLEGQASVYDAIPTGGCWVSRVSVSYADDFSESAGGAPDIGYLNYDENGYVRYLANEGVLTYSEAPVTSISFYDENDALVYQAYDPEGVGTFYQEGDALYFLADMLGTVRFDIEPVAEENIFRFVSDTVPELPSDGMDVYKVEYWNESNDSIMGVEGTRTALGKVFRNVHGDIVFQCPGLFNSQFEPVYICLYDKDGETLFESYCTDAEIGEGGPIGQFTFDDNGDRIFTTDLSYTAPDVSYAVAATEAPAEETAAQEQQGVTRVRLNIYAAPNVNQQVLGSIDEEQVITILQQETVTGNGESTRWGLTAEGWILLADVELMEEVSRQEVTMAAAEQLNVYSTPAAQTVLGTVSAGETVEILQQQEVSGELWGLCQAGWVKMEYLLPVEAMAAQTTGETETAAEPETIQEETFALETVPEETVCATEPVIAAGYALEKTSEGYETYSYYDYVSGQRMVVEYVYEDMPAYTVTVQLAKGAMTYEYEWVLLGLLYAYQSDLPMVIGVCLLLFAILAVYLCCAAGKKPGTTEIRPAGLNCIPLDLYAVAAVGGVVLLIAGGMAGAQYLLQRSTLVGMLFLLLMGYCASLLAVGFCFACAAQFKTSGGYWWRNSLCGRCLRLAGWGCRLLLKFTRWAAEKCESRLWPGFVKLCQGMGKVLKVLLKQLGVWLQRLVAWLQRGGDWLGRKLNRFFSLLPLTWQWLLVGIVMVFFLFAFPVAPLYRVLLAICIVLYGAHCFGVLLESAKCMRSGDLEEKVDDRLMTGSFKEFAGELNSLADVAVVAAQKQLKSERMKTELITNVSHDIKTPLTSIINYVDLLQKPHSDAEQAQYLEVLDRQSQSLKKLIEDLMEMSKASTGNMAVDITRVDTVEAVNQALGEFSDKLAKAELMPVFRRPEEPVFMMADGRLAWRVMSNLLSNAVKYALPGTRLYVDLQKLEGKVILSMKNISREELNVDADELLERFVRGDASRNTEGSGLGLNIAQSLMQLQKGQLQILVDGDLFKVTLIFPGAE